MYIEFIAPIIAAVFVAFGWCRDLLKQLKLTQFGALLIIAVVVIANQFQSAQAGTVVFGWGGILLIVLGGFWLFNEKWSKAWWAVLGITGAAITYILLGGLSDMLTSMRYGELYLGLLVGASAFLFSKTAKIAAAASIFGILFGDIIIYFIYLSGGSAVLLLGAAEQFTAMSLALVSALLLHGVVNMFSRKKLQPKSTSTQFETADVQDEIKEDFDDTSLDK